MSSSILDRLTDEVTDIAGRLESPAEASAVLESLGYTDETAREMGYTDIFLAGVEVYEHQSENEGARRHRMAIESELRQRDLEAVRPTSLSVFLPRFLLKGFTFAAPMIVMLVSVLVLLYSLWAYFYFDVPRGSAIAVGTVGSYLITAGFMQAIGRRGLMYLRQDMAMLSLKISMVLMLAGLVTVAVSAVLLWGFLLVFPVLAPSETGIAVLYFVTMSCLWLGLSIVYMLQQEIWFLFAISLGIAMVWYLREQLNTSIVLAHQIGILTAGIFSLFIGAVLLLLTDRRVNRDRKVPLAGTLPRFSVIALSTAPYFAYGFVYFAFLFTDRLMAWTGRTAYRQSFVWFQSNYEIGLNWALVSLIVAFGVLEFTTYRLGELVAFHSQQHSLLRVDRFTGALLGMYRRAVLAYLGAAVFGIIAAYIGVRTFLEPNEPLVDTLIDNTAILVYWVAAVSYLFVVWALLNNVFLFSFSRPGYALRGVIAGIIVNITVGFILSRVIQYWAAVFGLLAGAIVLWAISTYYVMKMLRKMDYYAYSAF